MKKPRYSFFPLHPYHLDAAMTYYFPEQNCYLFGDAEHEWYKSICGLWEILLGKFPKTSMRDIEEYCEIVLDSFPYVSKTLGINYQNEFHNCQLLEAIIYANIDENFIEIWKTRLTSDIRLLGEIIRADKRLLDMAVALREEIHDTMMGDGDDYLPSAHWEEYPDAYERSDEELNGDYDND